MLDTEGIQYQYSTDEFFIGPAVCVNIGSMEHIWYEVVQVAGSQIKMKIDTGAETNSIPMRSWNQIPNKPMLRDNAVLLKSFGGTKVDHTDMANVIINMGVTSTKAEISVTSSDPAPILGLKTCRELDIVEKVINASVNTVTCDNKPITHEVLKEDYTVAFEGHWDYPGDYHIILIENPEFHIDAPKRIAPCLKEPLKQKLQELEADKIITKTEEPTDWVHNLPIVQKKDGSLRLCLSPKTLNACIRREHFQIPTLDNVLPELAGKRVFLVQTKRTHIGR